MSREFSLLGFIQHLSVMAAEVVVAEHEGLERAARIIEAEAEAEIGHYQEQAGEFEAWQELAESTKDERVKLGFTENDPLLRDGSKIKDTIEYTVGDKEAEVGTNSQEAEWAELGTSKMPPRSFLGGAAVRKGPEAARAIGMDVVTALVGEEVFEGRLPISR